MNVEVDQTSDRDRALVTGGLFVTARDAMASALRRAKEVGHPRVVLRYGESTMQDRWVWHHMAYDRDVGLDETHRDFYAFVGGIKE